MNAQVQSLVSFVEQYPKLFVLTGAGCSTASGLSDYRDQSGNWKRAQPITIQTFMGDLSARKRYWARGFVGWQKFRSAQPGVAHTALVQLQQYSIAQQLVTQNVDALHQKAGHKQVIDLHGRLDSVNCTACDFTVSRDAFQSELLLSNPWLADLSAAHAPDGDADLELDDVSAMQLPPCRRCGAIMKPSVVFFGENVAPEIVQQARDQLAKADALMVVGSSLMVFSGFRFAREAANRKQPLAIVCNGVTRADHVATLKITGDCGSVLAYLAEAFQ